MLEVWAVIFACLEPRMVECEQLQALNSEHQYEEIGECRDDLPSVVRWYQVELDSIVGQEKLKVMGKCQYVSPEESK